MWEWGYSSSMHALHKENFFVKFSTYASSLQEGSNTFLLTEMYHAGEAAETKALFPRCGGYVQRSKYPVGGSHQNNSYYGLGGNTPLDLLVCLLNALVKGVCFVQGDWTR